MTEPLCAPTLFSAAASRLGAWVPSPAGVRDVSSGNPRDLPLRLSGTLGSKRPACLGAKTCSARRRSSGARVQSQPGGGFGAAPLDRDAPWPVTRQVPGPGSFAGQAVATFAPGCISWRPCGCPGWARLFPGVPRLISWEGVWGLPPVGKLLWWRLGRLAPQPGSELRFESVSASGAGGGSPATLPLLTNPGRS